MFLSFVDGNRQHDNRTQGIFYTFLCETDNERNPSAIDRGGLPATVREIFLSMLREITQLVETFPDIGPLKTDLADIVEEDIEILMLSAGATIPPKDDDNYTYCYNILELRLHMERPDAAKSTRNGGQVLGDFGQFGAGAS